MLSWVESLGPTWRTRSHSLMSAATKTRGLPAKLVKKVTFVTVRTASPHPDRDFTAQNAGLLSFRCAVWISSKIGIRYQCPKVLHFLVHKYVHPADNGVKLTREFQPTNWVPEFERARGRNYHLDGPIYRRTAEEKKLNEIVREDVFRSAGLWAGIGPGNRK